MDRSTQTQTSSSLRSRIVEALKKVGLQPEGKEDFEKTIAQTRSLFDKNKDIKERYGNRPPMTALQSVAVLKIAFFLPNKKIEQIITCSDPSARVHVLRRQHEEIQFLASAYEKADRAFDQVQDEMRSDKPFENLKISEAFMDGLSETRPTRHQAPLHILREIKKIRQSADYQEGDPNSLCKLAEEYLAAGAFDIAAAYIEEVLEDDPEHAGGWCQKARLLLAQSKAKNRDAARFGVMSEEADAMSAAETHYADLRDFDATKSMELEAHAFNACLKAYRLLPSNKAYEAEAIQWSRDYGTLRQLRHQMRIFIVKEAGKLTDPRSTGSSMWSRLSQTQGGRNPTDHEASRKGLGIDTCSKPVFSVDEDAAVLAAYKELKAGNGIPISGFEGLMLGALNFLRLLADPETYKTEVREFIEALKRGTPENACACFGAFSEPDALTGWRNVLHDHLDAVLTRDEQRALIRSLYAQRISDIKKQQSEAVAALYDDEIAKSFEGGNTALSLELALRGEAEGVYSRDDGHGALVLFRSAQHALKSQEASMQTQLLANELSENKALRQKAESYFDEMSDYYKGEDWFDDDFFLDHLLPPPGANA